MTGPQAVTLEDTFSCIYGSIGRRKPASEHLMSEAAIVAGIAKAALAPNPKVKWDEWIGDYALIRDLIAETYPDEFHDFNARMWTPGGFYRGNSARERVWRTESGKADFTTPRHLSATGFDDAPGGYRLITMLGAYYPEMNPLIALWNHDEQSKTPRVEIGPGEDPRGRRLRQKPRELPSRVLRCRLFGFRWFGGTGARRRPVDCAENPV